MLKYVLCLCALSTAFAFCAFANEGTETPATKLVDPNAPAMDQDNTMAGCGCKNKDKSRKNPVACDCEEEEEMVVQEQTLADCCKTDEVKILPEADKEEETLACGKCGNHKHRLFAMDDQKSDEEVILPVDQQEQTKAA